MSIIILVKLKLKCNRKEDIEDAKLLILILYYIYFNTYNAIDRCFNDILRLGFIDQVYLIVIIIIDINHNYNVFFIIVSTELRIFLLKLYICIYV